MSRMSLLSINMIGIGISTAYELFPEISSVMPSDNRQGGFSTVRMFSFPLFVNAISLSNIVLGSPPGRRLRLVTLNFLRHSSSLYSTPKLGKIPSMHQCLFRPILISCAVGFDIGPLGGSRRLRPLPPIFILGERLLTFLGAVGGAALGDLDLGDFGLEILADFALEDVCEVVPKMFFGAAFFLLLRCILIITPSIFLAELISIFEKKIKRDFSVRVKWALFRFRVYNTPPQLFPAW